MTLVYSPALPVAVPLLGAATLAATRKWLPRPAMDCLALLIAAVTFAFTLRLFFMTLAHGNSVYWLGGWYPRGSMVPGIGFFLDPAGTGLAALAAFLTTLALLFSWRFIEAGDQHMHPLLLIFMAAMCGFCLTGDIFDLFVFFELMSIAAFALCGLKTAEPAPLQGSFNFAVTNTVAAFMVLTGIAFLYAATGALNMAQIGLQLGARHDPLVLFAFTFIVCGFLTKAAIVPFHLWLPDAHAVAPTPVCVLFSGLMVELGLYAVLRLRYVVFGQTFAAHETAIRGLLLTFAAVTVLIAGFMCYTQHHLKRMLAYSTVCHAGLMMIGLALGGPKATAALLNYVFAHAWVKGSLFFVSGILLHRLRSISEQDLFGKGKRLRWTALLWFLGGAGLASAPIFGTMLGEAGMSETAKALHVHGIEALFMFGGAMTAAAVFRTGMHIFFGWGDEPITDRAALIGELPETPETSRRVPWFQFLPPALCLALAVAITFAPQWTQIVTRAATSLTSQTAYLHTLYTGNNLPLHPAGSHLELAGSALRGVIATLLAALLAFTSVFRAKIARMLRLGAFLENGFRPLRAMQSGHPGDYTFWITAGASIFGAASLLLLRR